MFQLNTACDELYCWPKFFPVQSGGSRDDKLETQPMDALHLPTAPTPEAAEKPSSPFMLASAAPPSPSEENSKDVENDGETKAGKFSNHSSALVSEQDWFHSIFLIYRNYESEMLPFKVWMHSHFMTVPGDPCHFNARTLQKNMKRSAKAMLNYSQSFCFATRCICCKRIHFRTNMK